jgi:hypothetical protein
MLEFHNFGIPLVILDTVVNLYEFCSYDLIEKLTAFLQLQESIFRNMIVETSTTVTRRSLVRSIEGYVRGRG